METDAEMGDKGRKDDDEKKGDGVREERKGGQREGMKRK